MSAERAEFRRVRLLDLPVALYVAAEGQWKALLREYVLRGWGGARQAYGAEEVTRAGAALEAVTAVVLRIDEHRAVDRAPQRADLEIDVAALTPGDFGILQAVLDDAVQLSRNQQLLVLPACGEAVAQASGAQPSPWTLESDNGPLDQAPAVWDPVIEPNQDVAWLIGDGSSRPANARRNCWDGPRLSWWGNGFLR